MTITEWLQRTQPLGKWGELQQGEADAISHITGSRDAFACLHSTGVRLTSVHSCGPAFPLPATPNELASFIHFSTQIFLQLSPSSPTAPGESWGMTRPPRAALNAEVETAEPRIVLLCPGLLLDLPSLCVPLALKHQAHGLRRPPKSRGTTRLVTWRVGPEAQEDRGSAVLDLDANPSPAASVLAGTSVRCFL